MNKKISRYVLICFSLMLTFWLISLYELSATLLSGKEIENIPKYIGLKFLNHFFTVLFIFIIFFPVYYLIAKKKKKLPRTIIKVFFVLLVIIEFTLTKYSLTTLLNLGADLLGYSLNDIYITVTASESTSIISFLPFLIFPLLFLASCFFLRKSIFFKYSGRIFMGATLAVIIVKFALPGFSDVIYQNKLYYFTTDIIQFQLEKTEVKAMKMDGNNEYPFLKPSEAIPDVLGPLFNTGTEKPNIVVILVEGLGSEFVGERNYSGFTPYLNSLIPKSLYWDNFLSNTGRTFGALPSLFGSLPFGEKGFLEIEETPTHISLFSILKNNGYSTSFFSGDQSSFDKKINFLEYNGVENIIDENKYDESSFPKSINGSNGFSWGYSDFEIFTKTLATLDEIKTPRLDLIATLTIHEPFDFPLKKEYLIKVDSVLNASEKIKATARDVTINKDIFASILYADASIKMFMEAYKKRPEYNNTIFIITGDHRLIPIAQKDKLCRFNVPFFIYSPMLKKPAKMKSINSHFDFTPTMLAFLSKNYNVSLPKETAWIGEGIDTSKAFRNIHKIPLMRYKGSINDFVYKEYMYSDGILFKIKEDLNTYKISDDKTLEEITGFFNEFKSLNAYVTKNDKIYPKNRDAAVVAQIKFTPEEISKLKELIANLTPDQQFLLAREKAFNNERETARLICNYILKESPNYVDVRILKGRTFAWDAKYDESEKELLSALKRSPYYDDIYLALLDMYWWSSQNDKSKVIVEQAVKNKIKNDDVAFKMARAYKTMNNITKATKILDSILLKQPKNEEYLTFKKALK
ncbi:sulfatase-like hydrolase/transferase [Polaribacter glomeratus]|nr:sulfatase-like hydrolase/transferase [Polaribacter glomeratus]